MVNSQRGFTVLSPSDPLDDPRRYDLSPSGTVEQARAINDTLRILREQIRALPDCSERTSATLEGLMRGIQLELAAQIKEIDAKKGVK